MIPPALTPERVQWCALCLLKAVLAESSLFLGRQDLECGLVPGNHSRRAQQGMVTITLLPSFCQPQDGKVWSAVNQADMENCANTQAHQFFDSHSLQGRWAGLVTLTAYIATKIGIEEYLMGKVFKINYKLEEICLRWKVMPNKSTLINWTYRTCWNSGAIYQNMRGT